jgi:hypothetical protein
MNNMFNKCPACGGHLVITGCRCSACGMQMQGEFSSSRFSILSPEQLTFIEVFLKVRGNLSEAERVLGVSYPTIRNKLDEINAELDKINAVPGKSRETSSQTQSEAEIRRDILQQVAAGTLSPEEGSIRLQNLKAGSK